MPEIAREPHDDEPRIGRRMNAQQLDGAIRTPIVNKHDLVPIDSRTPIRRRTQPPHEFGNIALLVKQRRHNTQTRHPQTFRMCSIVPPGVIPSKAPKGASSRDRHNRRDHATTPPLGITVCIVETAVSKTNNDNGRPSNDIKDEVVGPFAHEPLIVDEQQHEHEHHRQQHAVEHLRVEDDPQERRVRNDHDPRADDNEREVEPIEYPRLREPKSIPRANPNASQT